MVQIVSAGIPAGERNEFVIKVPILENIPLDRKTDKVDPQDYDLLNRFSSSVKGKLIEVKHSMTFEVEHERPPASKAMNSIDLPIKIFRAVNK